MRGTLAWAFTTWLTLVGLQALATRGAAGRVGELFTSADKVLERLLDPTVPAIPDLRPGAAKPSSSSDTSTRPTVVLPTTPRLPVIGNVRVS